MPLAVSCTSQTQLSTQPEKELLQRICLPVEAGPESKMQVARGPCSTVMNSQAAHRAKNALLVGALVKLWSTTSQEVRTPAHPICVRHMHAFCEAEREVPWHLQGCDCVWAAVQRVDDLIGTTESRRGP